MNTNISDFIQRYSRYFIYFFRRQIESIRDLIREQRTAVYVHPMKGINVSASFVPDIKHTTSDVEIAERLLRSYSLSIADSPEPIKSGMEDYWTNIARKRQSKFF